MKIALSALIKRFVQGRESDYRKTFTICLRRNIVAAPSLVEIDRTRDRFHRCKLADRDEMIFLDRKTSKRLVRYGRKIEAH
jgi:hypothetical protein